MKIYSQMALWINSIKHVRKKLRRLYQEIEDEAILPSSFYESSITLISKLDKDVIRESNYILCISHECRFRNP